MSVIQTAGDPDADSLDFSLWLFLHNRRYRSDNSRSNVLLPSQEQNYYTCTFVSRFFRQTFEFLLMQCCISTAAVLLRLMRLVLMSGLATR